MLSFRQKILLSYFVVFTVFTTLTFPLVKNIVQTIAEKAMEDRADELITKIQTAPNNLALIRRLKEQQSLIFFRVSIITEDNQVLYDTHTKHLLGPRFSQEYIVDHPEVLEAFEYGVGYNEDYSELLNQKFSYFAKTFDFHGKTYVIRTAFPYKYFSDLTRDLEYGLLALTTIILLLFSVMTWLIINHFTKPIQQIISAVSPYQEGKQTTIPEITLRSKNTNDEFNKLALTLNSLSSKIQKHIDALKDFVANASHELKTPITIIRGFAETLHEHPDLPVPVRIAAVDKIVSNCMRMTGLIKDLLALSDVENIPSSKLQHCDLVEITEKCISSLQNVFKEAVFNIETVGTGPFSLMADPNLIELALMNLIENGAKYSKHPAQIRIKLENVKDQVKITISDQGIGIPQEDLEHIFERFYTVDKAHSQKMGGSGLGLSIVQTVIQKHFGTISVTSKIGEGTTFTIHLPTSAKLSSPQLR